MKAGLVTFYHIHHYGALLQAAATERAVERFGWDCEIIDYFVNQDNALFKRPTGLGSAAHDAHTALHYQRCRSVTGGLRSSAGTICGSQIAAMGALTSWPGGRCPMT